MTQITQSANLIENWIDNAAVKSIGSGVFPVVHPNTHAIPHSVVSASDSDIDNALHSSLTAFKSWKNTTHDERRDVLLRAAAILKSRSGEMYEAYASELDVDHHFVEFLVSITSSMMETAASLIIPALTGECPPTKRANVALYFCEREPLGVCLALAPWNAAPNLSIRAIINPLAAGNTVIFKTSDITPKTHFLWGDIFREAGLPDGCLNILHSSRENAPSVTQKLIADDRVRHVSFTGSTSVGKEIGKFAGHHLKPCLLEVRSGAINRIIPLLTCSPAWREMPGARPRRCRSRQGCPAVLLPCMGECGTDMHGDRASYRGYLYIRQTHPDIQSERPTEHVLICSYGGFIHAYCGDGG